MLNGAPPPRLLVTARVPRQDEDRQQAAELAPVLWLRV